MSYTWCKTCQQCVLGSWVSKPGDTSVDEREWNYAPILGKFDTFAPRRRTRSNWKHNGCTGCSLVMSGEFDNRCVDALFSEANVYLYNNGTLALLVGWTNKCDKHVLAVFQKLNIPWMHTACCERNLLITEKKQRCDLFHCLQTAFPKEDIPLIEFCLSGYGAV